MKVNVVRGTFSRMTGEVDFNPNKISTSSFDVCIDATTVNTDNKKEINTLEVKITLMLRSIQPFVSNQQQL